MGTVTDSGNVSLQLSELHVLRDVKTAYSHAVIYAHPHLGRVLVLDGEIQHVEAWAPLYHEPLVHLPAAFLDNTRSALLLGGGSFFAARELLKYEGLERLLMLDRDAELLDLITECYEHAEPVRRDARVEIRTTEAFGALPGVRERFDLIINDSVDLLTVGGRETFSALSDLLRPDGICSDVVYRHVFEDTCVNKTLQILGSGYRKVLSLIFVPEYPGILHLLVLWSRSDRLTQNLKTTLNSEQGAWAARPRSNPCEYYDPRFISYYLHLPRWVRERLDGTVVT